jgi:acylphosphatase
MDARAHVLISGRVQGVFFRSYIRNQANLRKLTGWVRNTKDGNVEALFEGDRDGIEEIIKYCRKGPEGSSVGDVKVEWGEYTGNFREFEIRE